MPRLQRTVDKTLRISHQQLPFDSRGLLFQVRHADSRQVGSNVFGPAFRSALHSFAQGIFLGRESVSSAESAAMPVSCPAPESQPYPPPWQLNSSPEELMSPSSSHEPPENPDLVISGNHESPTRRRNGCSPNSLNIDICDADESRRNFPHRCEPWASAVGVGDNSTVARLR